MDEFTFEELFFDGIPDAGYDEFARLCQDTANDANTLVSNSDQAAKYEGPQSDAREMSLLSENEKRMLQNIPSLCKKVEDLQMDGRDSIAEMNTMRRFLERLEVWVGQIHVLLQSIENRLAQGIGREQMSAKMDSQLYGEAVDDS